MIRTVSILFFITSSIVLFAQNKPVFQAKGFYWIDLIKDPNFQNKLKSPSEVYVTKDSIAVRLNNTRYRYVINTSTEAPKEKAFLFSVELDGQPAVIKLYRDSNMRPAITDNYKSWQLSAENADVIPLGFQLPGEPRIDVAAAAVLLVGNYKARGMVFNKKYDFNRDNQVNDQAVYELTPCQLDIELEFLEDGTGTWIEGQRATNCKGKEIKFTWKLADAFEGYKHYLSITLNVNGTEKTYVVNEQTKSTFNLGGNYTFDNINNPVGAKLYMSKQKKKK